MFKTTVKYLLLIILFTLFAATRIFAQTITVGTVDPGPYAPGSTVAVPFHINDAGGCIGKDNVFTLEMSDALGSFAAPTVVATSAANTFYATFLNARIPNGTLPGVNYQFRVNASRPSPGITSLPSTAIIVAAGTPVTAGITSFSTIGTNNEVFGQCNSTNTSYTFSDGSKASALTSTASFFNESTQTFETTNHDIKTDYNFSANPTNYTIIVKAVSTLGVVSTKAYPLINNPINSSIATTGNGTVCISSGPGGTAPLTYRIDPASIQSNYPGNLYTFSWGDGSTTVLTLCEIVALDGFVTHPYTRASCGNAIPGRNNKFQVDIDITNVYCGPLGNRATSYATIIQTPTNTIQGPANACTNAPLVFNNLSAPGPDPNSTSLLCTDNPNVRYIWLVDGVVKGSGYRLADNFPYTFTTHGNHTVTLREQPGTGNGSCAAADAVFTVCVQDPPTASFTLPTIPVCMSTPVTPTNTTNPDIICNAGYTYLWTVDKNTYTFAGGTSLASFQPQFNFTAPGTYKLTLQVTAPGGCTNTSASQDVIVAATPTAVLAPDLPLCGKGQTLTFDDTPNSPTRVTFAGASATEGSTFLWEVTGSGTYNFVNSTATSQYPQIQFDDFGTYHIKVTRTNACGPVIATQDITFQNSPTIDAGTVPAIICQAPTANAATVVTLNGSTANGTVTSPTWNTSGTGIFSSTTSLVTDYTPSDADYAAGSVTLTLSGSTGLAGVCATVTSSVTLNLTKRTIITSPQSVSICTNTPLGYNITTNNPGGTFSWTGTLISGSASGISASGTSSTINDPLVNTDPNTDAVIKYTITPTSQNGCPGDPLDVIVTIPSLPVITFTPPPAICSTNLAGITFSARSGTRYTWTVNLPTGVTGGNNQAAFTNNNFITDRLTNSNATTATVTYTITPYNSGTICPGSPVTISVDVYPAPVTSTAGPDQNLCGQTSTPLQGNPPGTGTGKWTVVTNNSGTPLTFDDDTSPTAIVSGLKDGFTYTLQWTITSPNGCTSQDQVNISVTAASVGGTTSGAMIFCPGPNTGAITLSGKVGNVLRWESSLDGVSWQTAAATNTTTTYTYNNLPQTTQFRAVVMSGNCTFQPSSPTTITINQAAPVATVGQPQKLCSTTTTNLTGNSPGTFVGTWTQPSGQSANITNIHDPNTSVTGLADDQIYTFKWTIEGDAPCPPTSATLTIEVSGATVPGTTSGANTICAGTNTGNIVLNGYHGNILRWESSTDGVNWQTATGSTTNATYTYNNLSITTQYRAVVLNGYCTPSGNSTATTITVNPPPIIATAGTNQILCNQPTYKLDGNDPGMFVGTWSQPAGQSAIITNSHDPKTTVTGLIQGNSYTFTWTISGLPPCGDSFADVKITNNADVVPSFTTSPKNGCGNLTVNFTNTSNNQNGALFQWNFGDGGQSSLASPQPHVFAQRTDGRDTTYYITLNVIGNCNPHPAFRDSVLVRPAKPIARILPASTNGCGNFAIDVRNTSPGNNVSYDFYLYNGTNFIQKITKTDKTDAIFDPITTTVRTTFTVYMIATGYCGATDESTHIPVVISPSNVVAQMFLKDDVHSGCAPLNTTLVNNSFGGNNFYYTVYDANNNVVDKPVASTPELPYTFTKAGTYYVTITAINSCGMNESPRTRVDVFPVPKPSFVADVTTACKNLTVSFTNNTLTDEPNTPPTSLIYDWDFGDGTTHSALFAPVHVYKTGGTYTVTLMATNTASGCNAIFTRQSYIIITTPPQTAFTVQPDSVITIPNYTFSFIDRTTGNPAVWKWTFGDGQVSFRQNPTITFADTGTYKVTLTTTNAAGCDSTLTKNVRIGGVPGQLFLPNAFMPTSLTNDLRVFRAKGSGIKEWHLQVFNIYGQLLWETTKLSTKGEPVDGWDGTFNGVPMPQGVYQWQASATFINGTEWKGNAYGTELPKRVGSIHLIK